MYLALYLMMFLSWSRLSLNTYLPPRTFIPGVRSTKRYTPLACRLCTSALAAASYWDLFGLLRASSRVLGSSGLASSVQYVRKTIRACLFLESLLFSRISLINWFSQTLNVDFRTFFEQCCLLELLAI